MIAIAALLAFHPITRHAPCVTCHVAHTSYVTCHVSIRMSHAADCESRVTCHMKGVTRHVSHVTCDVLRIACVTCRVSRVTCHVSDVVCKVSRVRCRISSVTCRMKKMSSRSGRKKGWEPQNQAQTHIEKIDFPALND